MEKSMIFKIVGASLGVAGAIVGAVSETLQFDELKNKMPSDVIDRIGKEAIDNYKKNGEN